jgi:VIT1/CCC1 family predicted Fe2+/Mn2+ transporter
MAFDIGAVLKDMLSAAGDVLKDEAPKVKQCLKAAIEAEKDALDDIARARLAKEITAKEMQSQLKDEKDALRAALLVCEVKSKMAAQKAANAAATVFAGAVKTALKAI